MRNKNIYYTYILEVKDFVIIPIHTVPEAAVREIDELYDVVKDVQQRWTSEVNARTPLISISLFSLFV